MMIPWLKTYNYYEMKLDGMELVRDRNGNVNFRNTFRRREIREQHNETYYECITRTHMNVEWLFLRSILSCKTNGRSCIKERIEDDDTEKSWNTGNKLSMQHGFFYHGGKMSKQ